MAVKLTKYMTISGTIFLFIFMYFLISKGFLANPLKLKLLVNSFGLMAPLVFLLLQIIQVIIPIIPGGVTCGIGIILFGPFFGFVLNYVGSLIGAVIAFMLAKKYGKNFILKFTDQKTYDHYIGWLDKKNKFEHLFVLAILIPGFPDDLLCMLAGLTNMTLKKYLWIIILCKPLSLIAYSWGVKEIIFKISTMF